MLFRRMTGAMANAEDVSNMIESVLFILFLFACFFTYWLGSPKNELYDDFLKVWCDMQVVMMNGGKVRP